jgi:hypothetical protein
MADEPHIAVFGGFRSIITDPNETSEKDFIYMLLEVFATGNLKDESREPGAGEHITSLPAEEPLFDMFHLVREFGEGSPVTAAIELMRNSDFAIVILPYRKRVAYRPSFQTSVYALMEYAYAAATGLPVLVIAEHPVDTSQLAFSTELHRWPSNITRKTLKKRTQWESLHNDFKEHLKKFKLKKRQMTGLPEYRIDEFYRERLIPLLLNWHDIQIYNHSILPLSSSFLPVGESQPGDPWEKFDGVQEYPQSQPFRSLYFEVEEALLIRSSIRVRQLAEAVEAGTFDNDFLQRIYERVDGGSNKEPFVLTRYASLIPEEAYAAFKEDEDKAKRALARNLSILLQLYRLQTWENEKRHRIEYNLFGLKTYYPYSMPTTIYAERDHGEGSPAKTSGVWGFLRSSGTSEPSESDDAFIIGQNTDSVEVWKRHIQIVRDTDAEEKPRPLYVAGEGARFDEFCSLIGPTMCNLLRQEIERREGWDDVLRLTGLGSQKGATR